MPITAIISQPAPNSVHAAYRPIVFRVGATKTDGTAIPPVVYCDIYIHGIYYKTISKTQYVKLNTGVNTEWEFDIQDALQEYLQKQIANNGSGVILDATLIIAKTYCKFRSSGIDTDGLITTENTAPIQGTGNTSPVAGTGTMSQEFYGVNAALQHEDSQDLSVHLASFRNRIWDDNSFPVTHRPDHYKICKDDSDFFPILTDMIPGSIRLHYRPSSSNIWQTIDFGLPCANVAISGAPVLPDASVGNAYSYQITLTGSAPFAISNVVKPAWMNIAVVGDKINFSGTPLIGDIGVNINVSFDVDNCGAGTNFADQIDVTSCTIVSFDGAPDLPDALVDQAYNYSFNLNGTQPFILSNIIKPTWMTIGVAGAVVSLTGTPTDQADDVQVQFDITNCGGSIQFSDTFDINAPLEIIPVRYTNSLVTICAAEVNLVYTVGGSISSGLTVYTDIAGTVPLTGFIYILHAGDGTIYELDPTNGVIGVSTGLVC